MNIGYVIWISLIPVFLPFIYVTFIRDINLKKRFKDLLGEDETFIQWFQEEGNFPFSSFMNTEVGNIIIGKNNTALYKFRLAGALKYGRYCIVLLDTDIPSGIYGKGHIVRALSPLDVFPKGLPLRDASKIYNENYPPECIEIENNKAYLYYPLNNWFGYEGIVNAAQSTKAV